MLGRMGIGWIIGGVLCGLLALGDLVRTPFIADASERGGSIAGVVIFAVASVALFVIGRRRARRV